MKTITIRQWLIIALVVICTTVVLADPNDVPPVAQDFPFILILPYILGKIAHWYKKWQKDGAGITFWAWWLTDPVSTVVTLVVGISAFMAMYALNPAMYLLDTAGHITASFIAVFLNAIAADTLNSSKANTPP